MRQFFISLILLFALHHTAIAQREVEGIQYLHQLFEELLNPNDQRPLILTNRTLQVKEEYNSRAKLFKYLTQKFGDDILDSLGRLEIHRDLALKNCIIDGNLDLSYVVFDRSVNIYECQLHDLVLKGNFPIINLGGNSFYSLRLLDSNCGSKVVIEDNASRFIRISGTSFDGMLHLGNNKVETEIRVTGNIFHPTEGFVCESMNDSLTYGRPFIHNLQFDLNSLNGTIISIEDNTFISKGNGSRVHLRGNMDELNLEDNVFESTLDLTGLSIDNRFIMGHNTLKGNIAFNDLIFPEVFNLLRWEQIQGYRITVLEKKRTSETEFWNALIECNPAILTMDDKEESLSVPYFGQSDQELANADSFEKLIYSYKSLYSIYNNRGDLESANACYAEMKEVQRRRLRYIYETEGGFANYFRWQLLVLLKVYTNHGTDPALALVISVYVIFFFAVFYFFFPSEWDVTSKGKLIADFKDFIQKNEKGYLKPFFVVLTGFTLSLINAFTLSLNSFVTLGFGNIPAKGLARYICVLEGFIGWFLLSIFTVALINQVLA